MKYSSSYKIKRADILAEKNKTEGAFALMLTHNLVNFDNLAHVDMYNITYHKQTCDHFARNSAISATNSNIKAY